MTSPISNSPSRQVDSRWKFTFFLFEFNHVLKNKSLINRWWDPLNGSSKWAINQVGTLPDSHGSLGLAPIQVDWTIGSSVQLFWITKSYWPWNKWAPLWFEPRHHTLPVLEIFPFPVCPISNWCPWGIPQPQAPTAQMLSWGAHYLYTVPSILSLHKWSIEYKQTSKNSLMSSMFLCLSGVLGLFVCIKIHIDSIHRNFSV